MSTIDDVKARLDIVETVTAYVPGLKKSGRTWKANCPFHNERTPSFIVSPERGTWHCFGACATGGDVIEFVRRKENVDFKEALRLCADRAGVELRPPTPREQQQREEHERLLTANEAAAVFFRAAFAGPQGADARAYGERRGLDATTLETWQIGYAPSEWNALTDHLRARGYTDDELERAGLAIEGDRGLYDRFRDRIIFPTRDARGRLVGFGARALRDDQQPKYLNTPQTPLFDKSGTMYGLDRAAEAARRADQLIVVEGYMDVIGCHQAGIENVAASMGTSITEKQMTLVKRWTPNVVLMLDADAAGSEAALRAVEVASAAADHNSVATVDWRGLVSYQDVLQADIRVVALPEGEDPDSLVRVNPQALRDLISGAKPVADYLMDSVIEHTDLEDPRARSRALEALTPTVGAMTDPVVRAHYVQRLARVGRVDERTVLAMLSRGRGARPAPVPSQREMRRQAQAPAARSAAPPDGEGQLLRLLLRFPECRAAGLAVPPDTFEDAANRLLFEEWCEAERLEERIDSLDDSVRERLAQLNAGDVPAFDLRHLEEMVRDVAHRLRMRRRIARLNEQTSSLAEQVSQARRGGAATPERAAGGAADGVDADEAPQLASDYVELLHRQRELVASASGVLGANDDNQEGAASSGEQGASTRPGRRSEGNDDDAGV